MDLIQKNIIVTGGANGIGKVLAISLLDEGANVCVIDFDEKALTEFREEYPSILVSHCDISNINNVDSSIEGFFNKFGSIDALINNAGMIHNSLFLSMSQDGLKTYDVEQWKKVIDINLNGTFYVTAATVKKMIEKRTEGVIINITSIAAQGNIGQSAYSASKAALEALTVTLSKELSLYRIRVAGLAPGFASTDRTMNSMEPSVIKDWKKKTPLRRMAKPEEIVDGILFILKNDFYNGQILRLDGGLRI